MATKFPPRIKLANLPTPIEKLERLSAACGGADIFVKRDDLTGVGLTGNKIRKLEYVIGQASEQGADMLITCGGIQSNHARATALAAAQVGMKSYLVLRGEETAIKDGNALLDLLVGSRIKYITADEYRTQVLEIMAELAENLKQEGYFAFVIPEGASDALGALGYFFAIEEIAGQLKTKKLKIDYVVCADGSGGTHAGLLLGKKYFKQSFDIIGFNVCDDEAYFVKKINSICSEAIEKFALPIKIDKRDIRVIDGYVGDGYALSRPAEIEFIKEVAQTEGLILDTIYTGKALYGLKDQISQGRFKKGEKVLFIHTGGIFSLFAKKELFY
jgi:D-cysteine desulfhydrase